MRKTKLLYSLALAPLLLGGYSDSEVGTDVSPLTVTALPKCTDGQFLVYRNNAVVCEAVAGGAAGLPDCKSSGQLLTYTTVGELSGFGCTPKGSIQISNTDATTINNLQTNITQLGTQIMGIGKGARVASRTYLGLTTATSNGNLGGAAAAANSCAAVYGAGAAMCDVYSIYVSVAAGKIDLTKDIAGAWVYQSGWGNPMNQATRGADVAAGLGENCAGYTSAVTNTGIAGTKFVFSTAAGGDATARVPKFYTNTTCDTVLPIACCN